MSANKNRTVDLLCGAFDLNDRRKFELTNEKGDHVVDLYFKAITRADRVLSMKSAGDDALKASTQLLCIKAELEDGTKAFSPGDAIKLQRELPEKVLNELELFLNGLEEGAEIGEIKKLQKKTNGFSLSSSWRQNWE